MNKLFIASTVSLAVLLTSCGCDSKTDPNATSEAKGGVYLGGALQVKRSFET